MIDCYIDLVWYAQVYGRRFRNNAEATEYYLNQGEQNGEFPNPLFNPSYYRECASVDPSQSSLVHYLLERKSGCRSSQYFDDEWYRWQNPDVAEFGCSMLHYLNVGGKEYRDPSPEVDMTALSRSHGQLGDGCVLTYLLTTGYIDSKNNNTVTIDSLDLVSRQRKFLQPIKPQLLKSLDFSANARNLLFVQCSKDSEFWSWFKPDLYRDWDLFLNCYAGDFSQTKIAEYVCQQPGTKFTGILKCWLEFGEIFDRYDFILFIDDDLVFSFHDISVFFKLMKINELDIAQPSLTSGSQCAWSVFYNVQKSGIRRTNGVEIMMPALSRRAREILLPYFIYSLSGFGLDLLMAKLAQRHGLSIGVVDDVVVRHEKKIDQIGGSYYEFLRAKGLNSKYELWRLVTLFGLEKSMYSVEALDYQQMSECS